MNNEINEFRNRIQIDPQFNERYINILMQYDFMFVGNIPVVPPPQEPAKK